MLPPGSFHHKSFSKDDGLSEPSQRKSYFSIAQVLVYIYIHAETIPLGDSADPLNWPPLLLCDMHDYNCNTV